MEAVRSYSSIRCGLPQERAGSAPALRFSRPAQRLSLLQPAHSPSRFHDPFHRRLQRLRCLYRCFSCYRVERTSSRAGLSPAEKHRLSTAQSRVEMWRGGVGAAYLFPALSFAGASLASPCSVSTSRSSNRTCRFPASGFPIDFTARLSAMMPSPCSRDCLKADGAYTTWGFRAHRQSPPSR